MLRYEKLDDISDGKLYSADDEAMLGTNGCKDCSYCCQSDMGHSIVLTPYDVYELSIATGLSFDDMLVGGQIEISMIDGLALPHLKMDEGCRFLKEGRCSVHRHRPGICRLFPLGRLYQDRGFSYILQSNECICKNRTPVVIRDWLGIDDLDSYDAFISTWHGFIKLETRKINEIRTMTGYEIQRISGLPEKELREYAGIVGDLEDAASVSDSSEVSDTFDSKKYRKEKMQELSLEAEERVGNVMKNVLSIMYMEPYADKDFYEEFGVRLKACLASVRKA